MNEAPPPSNVEAERELLGALLAYFTPELWRSCYEILGDGDDFYGAEGVPCPNRIVWRGICAVGGQGGHVDRLTVGYFLAGRTDAATRSYLDLAGGGAALDMLVCFAVPHGVVDRAAIIAKDGEWRRRLRKAREQVEACLLRDEAAWSAAGEDAPRLRVVA